MSHGRFAAALAALACVAFAGAEMARRSLWTTTDEVPHVTAAREWRHGPGMISNFEHPVLMKLLAGISLPREKPAMEIDDTRAGRRAFPFVLAALVVAAGLFGRALAGPAGGLAVAAVLAVEPTFRGHGALVHSDVLLTLFLTAAAAALEGAARRPRGSRAEAAWLAGCGGLYGLALASKYSALPFLAVFAPVAVVRLAARRNFDSARRFRAALVPSSVSVFALLVLPALATIAAVQTLAFTGTPDASFREHLATFLQGVPGERAALSLARFVPKGLAAYAAGFLSVRKGALAGERVNYFLGTVSGTGFRLYFPIALGIKLTAAGVFAALAAFGGAVFGLFRGGRLGRLVAARAWLPAALGGAYLAAAASSNLNIGVRHALPAVPFLLVAAAASGRALLRRRPRILGTVLACVVVAAAGESVLGVGHEISFGNLIVGGPRGVPPILSDSNVDWGQEEGLAYARVRRGDLGTVWLISLGGDNGEMRWAGVTGKARKPDVAADTVFFSRFLWDVAAAAEKNTESSPMFVWLRAWLPPLRRGLEARATSIEPFGDAYFLMRLRPPTAAPSSPPGSTP